MLLSLASFFLKQSIIWPRKGKSLEVLFGCTGYRNTEGELKSSLGFYFDNFLIPKVLMINSLPRKEIIVPGCKSSSAGVWGLKWPKWKISKLCLAFLFEHLEILSAERIVLNSLVLNSKLGASNVDIDKRHFLLKRFFFCLLHRFFQDPKNCLDFS